MHLSKVLVLSVLMFVGCSSTPQKEPMTLDEQNVFKVLIKTDIYSWLHNEDSVIAQNGLFKLPTKVSSAQYADEYKENQTLADEKYKDKTLIITGTVHHIVKTESQNNIIVFNGGKDVFLTPRAQMTDLHNTYIERIKEDDDIALICEGDGATEYIVKLKECAPISGYPAISGWIDTVINDVTESANTENIEEKPLGHFVNTAKEITSKLSKDSECFRVDGNEDKCREEISRALNI